MTTTTFAIAFAIIAVLFLFSHLRYRKDEEQLDSDQFASEVHLPSGHVLSNEEILELTPEELSGYQNKDLLELINYAGHQIEALGDQEDEELKKVWNECFEKLSAALYGYH